MKTHAALAALAITLTTGIAAQAAMVPLSVEGTFVDPGSSGVTVVNNSGSVSSFTWGNAANSGGPSSLTFGGTPIEVDTDTDFTLGTLTYYNGVIYAGSGTDAVNLDIAVTIGDSVDQTFFLTLDNTTNTGDAAASADTVQLGATGLTSANVVIGGESYAFEFLGFYDSYGVGIDEFTVAENGTTSANLMGRMTATGSSGASVPELSGRSSAGALFLALGAVAVATSRRRRAAKNG